MLGVRCWVLVVIQLIPSFKGCIIIRDIQTTGKELVENEKSILGDYTNNLDLHVDGGTGLCTEPRRLCGKQQYHLL